MFSSFRGDPELIKLVRTMKLIIVFLWVSVSALFANVAAQDMKLDLRVEHKSLIEVMDLLKQKSGFFVYLLCRGGGIRHGDHDGCPG